MEVLCAYCSLRCFIECDSVCTSNAISVTSLKLTCLLFSRLFVNRCTISIIFYLLAVTGDGDNVFRCRMTNMYVACM